MLLIPRFRLGLFTSVLAVATLLAVAASDLVGQAPDEPPAGVSGGEREEGKASGEENLSEPVLTPEELGLLPGRPRVAPTQTDTPPVIDGVLDDEVWNAAALITEFTQQAPIEGAPDLPPRVVPHPMLVPAPVEGREGRASSGTRATA